MQKPIENRKIVVIREFILHIYNRYVITFMVLFRLITIQEYCFGATSAGAQITHRVLASCNIETVNQTRKSKNDINSKTLEFAKAVFYSIIFLNSH